MKYEHGTYTAFRPHEMTQLDRIVADFEEKAKNYHALKEANLAAGPEPKEHTRKRERELQKALRKLQSDRLSALANAQVQVRLDKYRAALKPDTQDSRHSKTVLRGAMAMEKHHPTRVLAKYLAEVGRAKPDDCFTAHHIVQGQGRTEFAATARINLHFNGVRINDPDNGVWMPKYKIHKGHQAMPHAAAHCEIHTYNYEHWVQRETRGIANEKVFRDRLRTLRIMLRDGGQPDYVTEPPLEEVFGK